MEPIRVLEVLASGAVGGGSSHLESLIRGLAPERFAVSVATSGPLIQTLSLRGTPVLDLGTDAWRAIRRLNEAMRHAQLVHVHGTRAGLLALPGARIHGLPLLYTVHGWSFHPRRFRSAAASLEGFLARQCRHVVCVSQDDWLQGLDRGILQLKHSRVIPNGIDLSRFKPDPLARHETRDRLGIPDQAPLVGFMGRLTYQKAPELFVLAAHAVLSRFPEAMFLLIGDGPERSRLERLIQALGITSRIQVLGERHDVPELLAALDCFVLPSRWEGLPIALLEAMAVGVPAIATAVNGTQELIQPKESGWLVPPDQLAELITALFASLSDPARAQAFAQAARARIERDYALPTMIEGVQALYEEVIEGYAPCRVL